MSKEQVEDVEEGSEAEAEGDVPTIYIRKSYLDESEEESVTEVNPTEPDVEASVGKSLTIGTIPHGVLRLSSSKVGTSGHHSDHSHNTRVQIMSEVTTVKFPEDNSITTTEDGKAISSGTSAWKRRSSIRDSKEVEATHETMERELTKEKLKKMKELDKQDEEAFQAFVSEALEGSAANQRGQVQLNKGTLKSLQGVFTRDDKQGFFLEAVLGACHLKDLTSRYGTKAKNVRQFFLEAADADTKLAVFGPDPAQAVNEAMDTINAHGASQKNRGGKPENDEVGITLDDSGTRVNDGECNVADSRVSLVGVWDKKNFWDDLERSEIEQIGQTRDICAPQKEPMFELYGPKWRRDHKLLSTRDDESNPTLETSNEFEDFPDKYLDAKVQEVNQSEAVRRLWEIINAQLKLFNATDPLAYEMFGTLYDEVRNFVQLPEEEIISFNNGHWAPPPLDETQILGMEPFERMYTRFCVYQKAFSFLAQHFETLTPIFGDIKQAYEEIFEKGEKETLEVEKEKMEELELRETLGKHVRQTDKAGHRLLNEKIAEAHALQEHIQCQHHTYHTVLGILWKMRSSLKVTNWAVGHLKNMHKERIEALAREILSTEDQTMFQAALPGKYTETMQRIRDASDPKLIRRMLLAARRQLRAAHKKIVIFEADYADTVPKGEFEIPQKKFNIISKKNETLTDACNVLKTEKTLRKQAIAALKSEIYETGGLVKDLVRKPTPRPSWTKISYEWPGGQSKFSQIKEGKSTRQIINRVVEEMSGKKVGEITDYIQPAGLGDNVPTYLRYDKPLLMRSFTANEAIGFVKDIWKKRSEGVSLYRKIKQARRDEEDGVASYPDDLPYEFPTVGSFEEFVTEYFQKRCHLEQIRMEWTYNLMEAFNRFPNDPKMSQFKGVLNGYIDESVYHLFQIEYERIRDFMYARSNDAQNPNKGFLEWPDVMKFIGNLCPNKTEDEINALNNLGAKKYGVRGDWAVVRVEGLFEQDDEGRESDFVEMLYVQFEEGRKLYIRDIYMELLTELGISEKLLEHEDDPVWQTDVSMHMFYACVVSIDPDLPDTKLINYMAWVYMRVTGLPGVASLSTRLVEFLKARTNISDADIEKINEEEDIEFENCIREIRDYEEEDSNLDRLELKRRRLQTKKLRFASLRQVMDGLHNGPFVRHGKRVIKDIIVKEPEVDAEGEKKQRKHRHRHRKHRQEKKEAKVEEEEEADVDDDFGFD